MRGPFAFLCFIACLVMSMAWWEAEQSSRGGCSTVTDDGSCMTLNCNSHGCAWPAGEGGSSAILLYADKSGSMCGRDCFIWGCADKLGLATAAFEQALPLVERADFAKLAFVDKKTWQRSRLHRPDTQKYEYHKFSEQWKSVCGGRSRIWQTILEDAKAVVAGRPSGTSVDVIIITDGLDNESQGKLARASGAREMLSELHGAGLDNVVFNIVGIGKLDKEVSDTFETVSGLTGGQSFMVGTANDVAKFSTRFVTNMLEEATNATTKAFRIRERKLQAKVQIKIYDKNLTGLVPYLVDTVQSEVSMTVDERARVEAKLRASLDL